MPRLASNAPRSKAPRGIVCSGNYMVQLGKYMITSNLMLLFHCSKHHYFDQGAGAETVVAGSTNSTLSPSLSQGFSLRLDVMTFKGKLPEPNGLPSKQTVMVAHSCK